MEKDLGGGVVFQEPALADDLLLLGKHFIDIVAAQSLVLDDDFGEHVFRLAESQAERGLQQAVPARLVQINLDLLKLFDVVNNLVQQSTEIILDGSGKLITVISFSNSVGISSTGETSRIVLKLFFK